MLINMLKSKISYATVSDKNLYYVGSITIDQKIMEQANIQENEKVQIVNLNNGERFETYVITGKPDSLTFSLNGPAARKCEIGDEIFILSYAFIDPAIESIKPILVNIKNKGH